MWKVPQSLGQAAEKLRQAVGRLQGQEKEMWLQQSPQIWNRPRQLRL